MLKQVWAQIPSATNISSAGEQQQMLIWKPNYIHLYKGQKLINH